jgi:[protein-PII] uridylyltransferase
LAKIATHLDQVLDVFYVTDQHGHKITDDARLQAIESRLLEEINQHERQETSRASAY